MQHFFGYVYWKRMCAVWFAHGVGLGLAVWLALWLGDGLGVAWARPLAVTITVNTTADELNADGDCSLREAIQAANTNVAVDACVAGSGAIVNFGSGASVVIQNSQFYNNAAAADGGRCAPARC